MRKWVQSEAEGLLWVVYKIPSRNVGLHSLEEKHLKLKPLTPIWLDQGRRFGNNNAIRIEYSNQFCNFIFCTIIARVSFYCK